MGKIRIKTIGEEEPKKEKKQAKTKTHLPGMEGGQRIAVVGPTEEELAKIEPSYLGAQDIFWEKSGPYTGEISSEMLHGFGVSHVLVGHSDRRNVFSETDEIINKKIKAALGVGIVPILLVGEKEKALSAVLPSMQQKYHATAAKEEALIYRGLEGQKNIFRDMIRVGADSYAIGAKGGWYDPRIETARKEFFKKANQKKMKFIQLFDYDIKKLDKFIKNFSGKLKYRILPKEYSTNSLIHIFGDYVITYTGLTLGQISADTIFFVIHSKDLAESYRQWFWYMWKQSSAK